MTSTATDHAMLAALRAGDEAAFERFFRTWYARLADYAFRLLDHRDQAEDAVQEVMLEIWRRHEQLPDAEALPGYLHRSVRNRALNQLRRDRRLTGGDPETLPGLQSEPLALRRLMEADLALALADALGSLAPRTREVFVLSREQGLTYPQIATTLDISVKTVETLMGRALKALRLRLGGQLLPDG